MLQDNTLFVCSTNAYMPLVNRMDVRSSREISINKCVMHACIQFSKLQSSTLRTVENDISGAAICPVDPNDNGTAVWVGKQSYQPFIITDLKHLHCRCLQSMGTLGVLPQSMQGLWPILPKQIGSYTVLHWWIPLGKYYTPSWEPCTLIRNG